MTTGILCEQCGALISGPSRLCQSCGARQSVVREAEVTATAGAMSGSGTTVGAAETEGAGSRGPTFGATGSPQFDTSTWPVIGGLPVELWAVVAAFGIPGAWLTIKIISVLPSAFQNLGSSFLGFRIGLALLLMLVLVGLVGVAMLGIAWKLYRRDRVGRGLAYAFAGTLVISIAFSNSQTEAEIWAMILSIVGIAILALAPRVKQCFDAATTHTGVPTSVIVSRTLIAIFTAFAVLVCMIYLLLATVSGKYAVAGIVAGLLAVGANRVSKRLEAADRQARVYISAGAGAYVVLLLIFGQAAAGLLVPFGFAAATVAFLWMPNDSRAFFGDPPISYGSAPR